MDLSSTPAGTLARRWQWLLIALIVGWLIWLLAPVLTPFVCAALLGWLGDPWVDRLERSGRSRTTAVVLVFTLMVLLLTLALVLLVPMIERQVATVIESLPAYHDWFVQTALPWVERRTGLELVAWLDPDRVTEWVRSHWQQAGGVAATLFGYFSRSGFAVMAWVANLVLLPILTFYFLRDWDVLVERIAALVPRDHIATVTRLALESNEVLGAFLRGQFLVMLALGAIYAIGLSVVGLKVGLLVGIIAGLISFVPYLGTATGIVLGVIAALMQSGGDWSLVAMVMGVFVVGQMLEGYVLTPRIVGDRIGLHPVAVIFAIMAGGQLFGFLGMLLALPIAAIANVLLRFAHERYTQSRLYAGDRPSIVLDSYIDKGSVEQVAIRDIDTP
ncbi:putative PurR-regulated permease PerM [Pseudoxanthomonas japonensis]|uniref:AI-2E family transporter n=1 Tax=Pseudoxanthomonas TaxID=83618 RepID=UPI0007829041|nr:MULTISPECIES: AI-2E family transporter [Pseudoxanthomonas]MBA3931000.1 AI-2E family transporter [Xanthomonas sp.]MBL8255318.1 AI-2E family transporter [Pseudoxanthomonas mexicana]MDR7067778.1 putative PurR-regulated permease PerM [Pseudoxanthomonas japonensis]